MKALLCLLFIVTSSYAQDPMAYLKNFDAKVYSLKTKGVKDFVVDIESSKLLEQMNEQGTFGRLKELKFRVFWTASPERLAIEVIGLPEGFKEVKEELKASIMGIMDNLVPQTIEQRFNGYKISGTSNPKEFVAKDLSGIAAVPSFLLKFDKQDKLVEVEGQKPIGTLTIIPDYAKESFSDGRWVLKGQTTVSEENGQNITIKKELSYGTAEGMAVLKEVEVSTEQKSVKSKSSKVSETLEFNNYKINSGEALKYFLGESTKEVRETSPSKPATKINH